MTPALRDVTTLAESLARLRPFPAVVDAVRRAAADRSAGVNDVVRFLEADVGVATDLLRVANAPTSALAQKCTSIRHAASLLGMQRIVELVTSAAALALVEKSSSSFPELGAHVLSVAAIARALAPITGIAPDEAFTVGLLHDIGVLLLVESEDPFYDGLLDDSADFVDEPNVGDEVALMGFDHAALGEAVARAWNLPSPLPRVIGLHHDWEGARVEGGTTCAMVALLRAGDALLPVLRTVSTPSLDDLTPLFDEPAFVHLGLTREELHGMWEALRRVCDRSNVVTEGAGVDADDGQPGDRNVAPRRWQPPPPANLGAPPPPSTRAFVVEVSDDEPRFSWGVMAAAVLVVAGAAGIVMLLIR
jgi:HD-like signal output (HDOD) protein